MVNAFCCSCTLSALCAPGKNGAAKEIDIQQYLGWCSLKSTSIMAPRIQPPPSATMITSYQTYSVQSSAPGALLSLEPPKTLTLTGTSLTCSGIFTQPKTNSILNIRRVDIRAGVLWESLSIQLVNETIEIHGVRRGQGELFRAALCANLTQEVGAYLIANQSVITELARHIEGLLHSKIYIRRGLLNRVLEKIAQGYSDSQKLLAYVQHPLLDRSHLDPELRRHVNIVLSGCSSTDYLPEIERRNNEFVQAELVRYRDFFDTVEKSPLTEEQRISAIVFEDRNLLVAAAGSGKSSTLVSKIAYAIDKGLFKPEEILALAFNTAAAKELSQRIGRYVRVEGANRNVIASKTFNGMGFRFIRRYRKENGHRVKVITDSTKKSILESALKACLKDAHFAEKWLEYLGFYDGPDENDSIFKTLEDYEAHIESQRKQVRSNGQTGKYKALNQRDVLKSAEELAIANWCYINGVPIEYERDFPNPPTGWSKYQPDFYFPEIGVWLEHFALNKDGASPFGHDYSRQADEKRAWLEQKVPGKWFETRSHEYRDGTLLEKLKACLAAHGQIFRPLSEDVILDSIKRIDQKTVVQSLLNLIGLIKNRDLSRHQIRSRLLVGRNNVRMTSFLAVFFPLLNEYTRRVREQGAIDFEDMLLEGARLLENNLVSSPYKLILVDEFQDVSASKARFIKALLAQHEDSVLFGVGDDWQAINGFAGSDLRYFMQFADAFGYTAEHYLTETFRCSQSIADVGALFIQENTRGQKLKSVRSRSKAQGGVDLIDYKDKKEFEARLRAELDILYNQAERNNTQYSVHVLGRYRLGKMYDVSAATINSLQTDYGRHLTIEYLTAHGAKGLEADFVFVVGLGGKRLTFPCNIPSDPLVELLTAKEDEYPHAEERRLFYVAVTRAKQKVFLFFPKDSPSPFVDELVSVKYAQQVTMNGQKIRFCTSRSCNSGRLITLTGKNGPFLKCVKCGVTSNFKADEKVSNSSAVMCEASQR